jgi:G3E family GTPase
VDAKIFFDLFGSDATFSDNSQLLVSTKERANFDALLDDEQGVGLRKVTELLLEQVECADVILLNKIDLLESPLQVEMVRRCITSINPTAKVFQCVRGDVDEVIFSSFTSLLLPPNSRYRSKS